MSYRLYRIALHILFSGMDPIMENSPVTGRKHYNGGANYRYDSPDSPQTPEAWRSPDSPSSPISPYSPDSPGKLGFTRHERPVS